MLFLNEYYPYTIAIGLVFAIGMLELVSMLIGFTPLGLFDDFIAGHVDTDVGDNWFKNVLGWLHVGRVPLLILVVIFLSSFAVTGIALTSLFGLELSRNVGLASAVLMAFIVLYFSGHAIGKYFPQINSTAVSKASFVGCIAIVTGHTVTQTLPAEARVIDVHGRRHHILVKASENKNYRTGDQVLVIAQKGTFFYVTDVTNEI